MVKGDLAGWEGGPGEEQPRWRQTRSPLSGNRLPLTWLMVVNRLKPGTSSWCTFLQGARQGRQHGGAVVSSCMAVAAGGHTRDGPMASRAPSSSPVPSHALEEPGAVDGVAGGVEHARQHAVLQWVGGVRGVGWEAAAGQGMRSERPVVESKLSTACLPACSLRGQACTPHLPAPHLHKLSGQRYPRRRALEHPAALLALQPRLHSSRIGLLRLQLPWQPVQRGLRRVGA